MSKSFLIFYLLFSLSIFADDKLVKDPTLADAVEKVLDPAAEFEQIKMDRLQRIRNELVSLKARINTFKKTTESDDVGIEYLFHAETKLGNLKEEYKNKQFLFIEAATDIHLSDKAKKIDKNSFLEDLHQILSPLLKSFKQISDRPRQIQELKEKSESVEKRYQEALLAETKLKNFLKNNKNKDLTWKLKEAIKTSAKLAKRLGIESEDLKFRILKIESDQEPFIQTFSIVILDFFKNKGFNLLLAFIIFASVLWGFRALQGKFLSIILYQVNLSKKRESYQWLIRPIRVIYSFVSTVIAFVFGILTLYALNDWLLVTIILILVAALVWSSKQYLPTFLAQSKVILNLGSIRENERVLFQGIPWEIKSLGYYCRLYNPVLSGGFLRVNTKDIMHLCSRRIIDNEPWFPTKTGDWIEVDNRYAQVTLQSPEQVILKTIGSEILNYKASEFFVKVPKNHSNGFSIEFIFGVDYSHQKILFSEVIPTFKESVESKLKETYPDFNDCFEGLRIEFVKAGASSLDIRFFVKVRGSMASKKFMITRSIQASFVEVCNDNNYIIPFDQLTVHMEK